MIFELKIQSHDVILNNIIGIVQYDAAEKLEYCFWH